MRILFLIKTQQSVSVRYNYIMNITGTVKFGQEFAINLEVQILRCLELAMWRNPYMITWDVQIDEPLAIMSVEILSHLVIVVFLKKQLDCPQGKKTVPLPVKYWQ